MKITLAVGKIDRTENVVCFRAETMFTDKDGEERKFSASHSMLMHDFISLAEPISVIMYELNELLWSNIRALSTEMSAVDIVQSDLFK